MSRIPRQIGAVRRFVKPPACCAIPPALPRVASSVLTAGPALPFQSPTQLQTQSRLLQTTRSVTSFQEWAAREAEAELPLREKKPPPPIQKTPLYDIHVEHGAKMGPFAGYSMPLLYPNDLSHIESHKWTRERASLFDVSHMVQHVFTGPGALAFLESVTPSDLVKLKPFTGTLSCLLDDMSGGIIDDTIITMEESQEKFYVVTNAGCAEKDLAFFRYHLQEWENGEYLDDQKQPVSHEVLKNYGLVALQGPLAHDILHDFLNQYAHNQEIDLTNVYFGEAFKVDVPASENHTPTVTLHIARGGYTGEDGFEISIPPGPDGTAPKFVTKTLLEIGTPDRLRLAGLAARDSLRLEAGMCLYGHDLNEEITPVQAGLKWIIGKRRREAANFPGAKNILYQLKKISKSEQGGTGYRFRVGIMVDEGSGIAREGTTIYLPGESGQEIGVVTSGGPAPSLDMRAIAMGYVDDTWDRVGNEVGLMIRGKLKSGTIVKMPFVPTQYYKGLGEKAKAKETGEQAKEKGEQAKETKKRDRRYFYKSK